MKKMKSILTIGALIFGLGSTLSTKTAANIHTPINDDPITFQAQILEAKEIVIIDFAAEKWCQPCQQFGPIFKAVSENHENITFIKVDYDTYPILIKHYKIKGLPTIIALKNGEIIGRHTGFMSVPQFENWINNLNLN